MHHFPLHSRFHNFVAVIDEFSDTGALTEIRASFIITPTLDNFIDLRPNFQVSLLWEADEKPQKQWRDYFY